MGFNIGSAQSPTVPEDAYNVHYNEGHERSFSVEFDVDDEASVNPNGWRRIVIVNATGEKLYAHVDASSVEMKGMTVQILLNKERDDADVVSEDEKTEDEETDDEE